MICALCFNTIAITDKCYRSLSSTASQDLYKDVFTVLEFTSDGHCCSKCMNKLNRVNKLNSDLKYKLVQLQREHDSVIKILKLLPGVVNSKSKTNTAPQNTTLCIGQSSQKRLSSTTKCRTPTSSKRPYSAIKQTPTPKSKLKKCLFSSPCSSSSTPKRIHKTCTVTKKDQCTQTKDSSEDFEVKVTVRYCGKERGRIIREENMKSALKAVLNNSTPKAVIGHLCKDNRYKEQVYQHVMKQIKLEVDQLKDIFQGHASDNYNLINFDLKEKEALLKDKAPYFHGSLQTVVNESKTDTVANVITAASVLLYGKSQKQNLLPYILGLVMDRCGVTKEGLEILHDLGISVSTTSIQRKKKQLKKNQEKKVSGVVTEYIEHVKRCATAVDNLNAVNMDHNYGCSSKHDELPYSDVTMSDNDLQGKKHIPFEVLGDNLDVTINPASMTLKNQNQSLHWFLLLVKQKRVLFNEESAEQVCAKRDITNIPSIFWLPTTESCKSLVDNFAFHIAKVLLAYLEFLDPTKKVFPKYIPHKHLDKMKEKTVFFNSDLLDASENSSQGMIEILQRVHDLSVPHLPRDGKNVILEKVVFGGDVLTNERAFSAQEAMQNGSDPLEALFGVIHRPEGLHRMMNFTLVYQMCFKVLLVQFLSELLFCMCLHKGIYQLFYKEKTASDKGSLYQLRNLINRRSVSGPDSVIQNFRSHQQFLNDVTDAYIVAAFLDVFEMDNVKSKPINCPVFSLMNDEEKSRWVTDAAYKIINYLELSEFPGLVELVSSFTAMDNDETHIHAMSDGEKFTCALCGKSYKKKQWFRKHLEKKHQWQFYTTDQKSNSSKTDNPVSTFIFMSLLLRDTYDSYRMGDGDRIVRNALFEWLFTTEVGHTKYRIWLFRLISYVSGLLTEKQAYEYKWNMTVNLRGGIAQDIPNDNCVELQVHNIKKQLLTQGSNKSFQSARDICLTTQVVQQVYEQLMKTSKTCKSKRSRPHVDKTEDVVCIVECIRKIGNVNDIRWSSFENFCDPIRHIDARKLHEWTRTQKIIANEYMSE